MPQSPLAPSKSALRALRHLALAASCTVAFGTGLIAADRHRRIQTLQQACENARRIRTSRGYRSNGSTVAKSFEEQVRNYCENGPWKGTEMELILDSLGDHATSDPAPQSLESQQEPESSSKPVRRPRFASAHVWMPADLKGYDSGDKLRQPEVLISTRGQLFNESLSGASAISLSCQERLAKEVTYHLRDGSDNDVLRKAAGVLSQAFADGLQIHDLEKPLLEACVLFSQTCERLGCFKFYVPALENILRYGRVNEETFSALRATTAMAHLLEESGYMKDESLLACRNPEKLKDVTTIFCTNLHDQPVSILPTMLEMGTNLFTASIKANLYDIGEQILLAIKSIGGNITFSQLGTIILANRERRNDDHVLYLFFGLFSPTRPNQEYFHSVVRAALNTTLDMKRLDKAEEVLLVANQMAKAYGLKLRDQWVLQILGRHWRVSRNWTSTEALFGRIQPVIQNIRQPKAVYTAMCQICVESGNETQLPKYLELLPSSSLQTYGTLALSEAVKGNWKAVEDNFRSMKSLCPSPSNQAALFIPVFKRFVASHKPVAAEEFLRLHIEELGLVLNQYISNIMIGVYCKAKESDSLASWIQYVQTIGLELDNHGFNTILHNCQARWGMHYDDLYRLCRKTMAQKKGIVDATSIRILRRAAIISSKGIPELEARLLSYLVSLRRSMGHCLPDNMEAIMSDALAHGHPTNAIAVYEDSMRDGRGVGPQATALAVKASLATGDEKGFDQAMELIRQARGLRTDIGPALAVLIMRRMEDADRDDLAAAAIDALTTLEEGGFQITREIVTDVVSRLTNHDLVEYAIEIWVSITKRYQSIVDSIDIVLLTVLLKLFTQACDESRIEWVMDTLCSKNFVPDKRFKSTLKRARAKALNVLPSVWPLKEARAHCLYLDNCVQRITEIHLQRHSNYKAMEASFYHALGIRHIHSNQTEQGVLQFSIN